MHERLSTDDGPQHERVVALTSEMLAARSESWGTWRARLAEAVVVLGVLGAVVVYVAPTLGLPLLEKHAFRQTQTAYTARVFYEEGIDLLHPKLPVLGEPFEAPYEFPLFQAAASVTMDLGIKEDAALRVTSLACFLATALLLYGLVRYVAGRASGIAALAAFTFTPLALVWSRASMIEYLATAGAVGFAWGLIAWRQERRPLFGIFAVLAGLVGMLVKPTTAVFWILPALAYRPEGRPRPPRRLRFDPWTVVAVVVPLAAGSLWTRHADAIKAASPTTEWMTSWNLRYWNFGWLEQRFDPAVWQLLLERTGANVVGLYGILLLPAIVAAARSRQRLFWLGIASAALFPPLVFTNLYFHHDYYLVGISPAVAAFVGLGAGDVWRRLHGHRSIALVLPVLGLLLAYGSLELGRGYWLRIHGGYEDPQVLPLAREIQSHTKPDDLVAVDGLEWSPAVLYYARRRGHMVSANTVDVAYDLIHRDGYRFLMQVNPAHDDLGFLSRWRWVGALAPHLYAIGDSPTHMSDSGFMATNDDSALAAARLEAGSTILADARPLQCDEPNRFPSGKRGTWIRFSEPPPSARVFVSDLVPLPVRRAVFVAPELAERGKLTVTCTGADSLAVDEMIDAPGPLG